MSESLNVTLRDQTGSLRMKRMRQAGNIPAVLYGHGQENLMLSVSAKEMNRVINHGSYVVELAGAANESALVKEVQWDAFGINVLHVDFARVDADEKVNVTLPLTLKGDAVGTHHGGEVNFLQQELTIDCLALKVPEKIELKISDLDVNQTITAGDIALPEGAELAEDASTPIVSCTEKASATDGETGDDDSAAG